MNTKILTGFKSIQWLIATTALISAAPAHSEYYLGVDATHMTNKTIYRDGSTKFTLNPVRIKFGQRFEEFGWEIQGLTPSDDTGEFTGGGTDRFELRTGLGILFTVSTPGRGFYGGIGFTQILADYSELNAQGAVVASSTHTNPFTTVNFGGQYEVAKNMRISLDYTFYHGQIDCTFCAATTTATSDPDVRLSTFGLGVNYTFK